MSISLPNGTILAAPSSQASQISAAVTRILHLANFSPELKTRDLQLMFKEWENDKGGFRIKWLDDINALVVFADAGVAKRAYLSFLVHTPSNFPQPATIRPYDRPDAAQIIQSLNARALGHRASMSSAQTLQPALNGTGIANGSGDSLPHSRTVSMSTGLGGFIMPTGAGGGGGPKPGLNANTNPHARSSTSFPARVGGGMPAHHRTGSASSWGRQSLAGGALSFPSSTSARLPTHSESSSQDPSRSASSSSNEDLAVVMDSGAAVGMGEVGAGVRATNIAAGMATGSTGRRDSLSAEKALREVEKALASVEAQG